MSYNKKISLIIYFCFLIALSFGFYKYQNQDDKIIKQCEDLSITSLKVKNIENDLSVYSVISKNIVDKSSQGGQQIDYLLNNEKRLIKQTFYGETGKSEVSYYLEDNKVFYINKKNTEYVNSIYEDPSGTIKNIKIKDFYLNRNQNLCFWFLNNKPQDKNKEIEDFVQYLILGLIN